MNDSAANGLSRIEIHERLVTGDLVTSTQERVWYIDFTLERSRQQTSDEAE